MVGPFTGVANLGRRTVNRVFDNAKGQGLRRLHLVPPLAQDFGLDPHEIGFDRGGATQAPQQWCQPQDKLTLDGGLGVVVRNDGRLERSVVLDILDNFDDGLRAQSMPDGVAPRLPFALLGSGGRCF